MQDKNYTQMRKFNEHNYEFDGHCHRLQCNIKNLEYYVEAGMWLEAIPSLTIVISIWNEMHKAGYVVPKISDLVEKESLVKLAVYISDII